MATSKGTMFDPTLVKDLITKVKGNCSGSGSGENDGYNWTESTAGSAVRY